MGSHRTQKIVAGLILVLGTWSVAAQEAGWHYSPLPGEGDRATLGCDREATKEDFACIAVRCEDDYSAGIHIHTSRVNDLGNWEITLDRNNAVLTAIAAEGPYGGRLLDPEGWLRDWLEQGTFIYLRHAEDDGAFRFITLDGSLYAINRALAFCAPRVPAPSEPNPDAGV